MKHLMRFVESVKLWWEIKHDEWHDLCSRKSIPFTRYEKSKLMELDGKNVPKKFLSLRQIRVDDYFFDVNIQNHGLSIYVYVGERKYQYDIWEQVLNCIKIDDEWFLVNINVKKTWCGHTYPDYFFYKCDGIEGLLDLIKILGFTYG